MNFNFNFYAWKVDENSKGFVILSSSKLILFVLTASFSFMIWDWTLFVTWDFLLLISSFFILFWFFYLVSIYASSLPTNNFFKSKDEAYAKVYRSLKFMVLNSFDSIMDLTIFGVALERFFITSNLCFFMLWTNPH